MSCGSKALLTISEVCALTRMGRSTVYRKVADGTFPRPIRLGPRMVRWWRCDVERWLASRPLA